MEIKPTKNLLPRHGLLALLVMFLVVCPAPGRAQARPVSEEDHRPAILGIEIGMTLEEVLARLEPLPYSGRDENEGMKLVWTLPDKNRVQVTFRKGRTVHLSLHYANLRRAGADLWLPVLFGPDAATRLTNPRVRRDYQLRERLDKSRLIWAREEETLHGYSVEIGFLSASRGEQGANCQDAIEFKYVTLAEGQDEKFEKAMRDREGGTIAAGRAASPEGQPPANPVVAAPALGSAKDKPLPSGDEDHQPRIRGIEIGMTAQEVLDRVGGRMPDARRDEKEEVIVYWRLEDGSLLQVNLRGEHVWHIALQCKKPRPIGEMKLHPLYRAGNLVELPTEEKKGLRRRE